MLAQHLLHCIGGEIRVDGGAAELVKVGENGAETRIRSARVLDDCRHFTSKCRHRLSEFGDSGVPPVNSRKRRGEEAFQCGAEVFAFGEFHVKHLLSVLIENPALRRVEKDVGIRIACVKFALDFLSQVIVNIFRFHESKGEPVFVQERAINDDAVSGIRVHCVLRHEGGIDFFGAGIK